MNKFIYIIIFGIIFYSCNDDNCYIQDVYVNKVIDLSLPAYNKISTEGNSMFIDGGVEGIIIFHGIGNNYKIYDRNCSYEPCLPCSKIDSVESGIAYCGCCTSVFDINNSGNPINAPALLPLKSYNYILDNNILRIFN